MRRQRKQTRSKWTGETAAKTLASKDFKLGLADGVAAPAGNSIPRVWASAVATPEFEVGSSLTR